jgi:hypothetical protein
MPVNLLRNTARRAAIHYCEPEISPVLSRADSQAGLRLKRCAHSVRGI